MKKSIFPLISLITLITLIFLIIWFLFFAAAGTSTTPEIISFTQDTPKILVSEKLKKAGYIKNELVLELLIKTDEVAAGGYQLSKSMNVIEIAGKLTQPEFLWVTVTPGMRKEQIAEKLAVKFNWTSKDTADFLSYSEGQYFPDTYLVPKVETGKQVGQRMVNRFNEAFIPLAPQFLAQNIKNDTALKIASLVQREAGGKDDMPLIAGIIWNRLLKNMLLQIDASNQYAIGKSNDWWPHVSPADLKVDSPYNLYRNQGLPPTPIASPGLDALNAVLNPAETDCLYYLHDRNKQIHCSVTYAEHLENIKKYLQ